MWGRGAWPASSVFSLQKRSEKVRKAGQFLFQMQMQDLPFVPNGRDARILHEFLRVLCRQSHTPRPQSCVFSPWATLWPQSQWSINVQVMQYFGHTAFWGTPGVFTDVQRIASGFSSCEKFWECPVAGCVVWGQILGPPLPTGLSKRCQEERHFLKRERKRKLFFCIV